MLIPFTAGLDDDDVLETPADGAGVLSVALFGLSSLLPQLRTPMTRVIARNARHPHPVDVLFAKITFLDI